MEKDINHVRLVRRAQLGDKECLEELGRLAEESLRCDVYRMTLRRDLTEDIVQEAMLEMLKILGNLKEADRFWPWLYKIAINKLRQHHRREARRSTVSMSAVWDLQKARDGREAMSTLVTEELKEIVVKAMGALRPQHRAVLTLRCYKEMDYPAIAESLGCSEFAARKLFYRAKKALQRQLAQRGFGKGSLLMALILFGKMTAPSEAAAAEVSVTAAATKVGVAAGLAGMVGSKTAVVSLVTAGVLGLGTMVATSGPDKTTAAPGERAGAGAPAAALREQPRETIRKRWYFFPEGTEGPLMTRVMKGGRCQWMQDEQANYYFDRRDNAVHVNNYRQYNRDLAVWRLPTDRPELTAFLSQVEGEREKMQYVSAGGRGLVVVAEREEAGYSSWATRHYQALEEEYVRYSWPGGVEFVDNRDAMHKRGWTYFRVEGRIGRQRVTGTGRVPFVYAARREYSPWVRLKVGHRLRVVDSGTSAAVYDSGGKVTARYAGRSFFSGLGRPWMGLHTIDTVRRDAAKEQVPFEMKYKPGNEKAEVILTCSEGKLVYTVDMHADVIDEIAISTGDGKEGFLRFSYLQDIEKEGDEFVEPRVSRGYGGMRRESAGILWLMQLATGDL
ncbi:MAG: RNA polymerase sigma factor [Planctomycetota bacterium]|jgi:RNA polymerase sigma-70 factor (ECF subfamily)